MIRVLTGMLFGILSVCSFAAEYEEGKHYTLVAAEGPAGKDGKVNVTEFFWFGCPHCHFLESYVKEWKGSLSTNVEFQQMPAPFNNVWKLHAQLFYSLEALNRQDLNDVVFTTIHEKKQPLNTYDAIRDLMIANGVDGAAFDEVWKSLPVRRNMMSAHSLVSRYRLTGVPGFVVNGKWLVTQQSAGTPKAIFEVIDYLVTRELAAKKIDKQKKRVEELGP